jgi:hypothetical protein
MRKFYVTGDQTETFPGPFGSPTSLKLTSAPTVCARPAAKQMNNALREAVSSLGALPLAKVWFMQRIISKRGERDGLTSRNALQSGSTKNEKLALLERTS